MKNKGNHIAVALYSILSLIIYQPLYGQERINFSAGFGFPELLNVGVRIPMKQTQLGFSVGYIPIPDETNLAISGDAFFHIGGFSELSTRRPWYIRTGLTYQKLETEYESLTYFYFNPRLGREINLSKKIGFQIDLGLSFQLSKERETKTPSFINPDMNYPVLPSFGAALFYRL